MGHAGEREGRTAGSTVPPSPCGGIAAGPAGWTDAFRIAAAVTVVDVVVAAGLSVGGLFRADLVAPGGTPPDAEAIILAMHAAGPRLALACVCVLAIRTGSRVALTALGTVAGLVQGLDAATAAMVGDVPGTIIPATLGMAQCLAITVLDLRPRAGERAPGAGQASADVSRS